MRMRVRMGMGIGTRMRTGMGYQMSCGHPRQACRQGSGRKKTAHRSWDRQAAALSSSVSRAACPWCSRESWWQREGSGGQCMSRGCSDPPLREPWMCKEAGGQLTSPVN